MTVFDVVIATLNKELTRNLESNILQLCAQVAGNLILLKDNDHKLSIQGSLASLTSLESRIKLLQNQCSSSPPPPPAEPGLLSFKAKKISGVEAQSLGLLKQGKKGPNRDDKLSILRCKFCSYSTKRPNRKYSSTYT